MSAQIFYVGSQIAADTKKRSPSNLRKVLFAGKKIKRFFSSMMREWNSHSIRIAEQTLFENGEHRKRQSRDHNSELRSYFRGGPKW